MKKITFLILIGLIIPLVGFAEDTVINKLEFSINDAIKRCGFIWQEEGTSYTLPEGWTIVSIPEKCSLDIPLAECCVSEGGYSFVDGNMGDPVRLAEVIEEAANTITDDQPVNSNVNTNSDSNVNTVSNLNSENTNTANNTNTSDNNSNQNLNATTNKNTNKCS